MRSPEVGENGGRTTISRQENGNILLLYLGGCKILGDSIPRTGVKTNKKRMSDRHQINSKRSLRWCLFRNGILESHPVRDGVLSSHRVQHQGGGCSILEERTQDI